jgi:queuine/archaeosine tRNA-ribosyltransferase
VHFYQSLMRQAREAIQTHDYEAFRRGFLGLYGAQGSGEGAKKRKP